MDSLLHDLRYALRSLRQTPAFAGVVVVTLALGIGANSAIFSVVNGVLLRPLPYPEPDRIVQVNEVREGRGNAAVAAVSGSVFRSLSEEGTVFEHLAMYSDHSATLTGRDTPLRLSGWAVSPSLFPLLRAEAGLGRTFSVDEAVEGFDGVAILSDSAWRRYFGGDPSIIGERILLDGEPYVVVGVMPPGFEFPELGADYWVPLVDPGFRESDAGAGGGMRVQIELMAPVIGRLRDSVTIEQAIIETNAHLRNLRASPREPGSEPGSRGRGMRGRGAAGRQGFAAPGAGRAGQAAPQGGGRRGPGMMRGPGEMEVESLQDRIVGRARPALLMLMGTVGFVLLIACANVANLVMARSGVRRRETAVRAALGAGGFRLVRLLLVEGLMLALAGGALGLGLAWSSLRLLMASPPEFIPRIEEIGIDLGSVAFTLAVSALTALLFSLLPARNAVRIDLTSTLKEGGGGDPSTLLGRGAARKALVAAEVALSVVLLVGAGLLVSSFVRLATVDPGFDAANLLDLRLQLSGEDYQSREAQLLFQDRAVQTLSGVEGVEGVGLTSSAPSFPTRLRIVMRTEQQQRESSNVEPVPVGVRLVSNRFLDVVGARLVDGRLFSDDDRAGSPPVAVMSRAAAEGMYPGASAVGQRLRMMAVDEVEIVGVVEDFVSAGVDPEPQPEIFVLYAQAPEQLVLRNADTTDILVRTAGAPLRLLPTIQGHLPEIAPGAPAAEAATVADLLADEIAEPRFYAGLVAAFAGLAVILATVGIYGVLSYSVQQRVQETAIRRALGARSEQVLLRVVREGVLLAIVGLAIGLAAALGLTRILEAMLYEIEPTDPLTYVAAGAIFLAVALTAVYLPARRATRIDPMRVLRYDA